MTWKFKCLLLGHNWRVVHDASPWLAHLHPLAGTFHRCAKCGAERDWRGDPALWIVGPREPGSPGAKFQYRRPVR